MRQNATEVCIRRVHSMSTDKRLITKNQATEIIFVFYETSTCWLTFISTTQILPFMGNSV
jgi:hypothetical protein